MLAHSEQKKKSLQRRGKRLLKSKYKKSKTTLSRMKHKSKMLFASTIIMPSNPQPSLSAKPNTIGTINSTITNKRDLHQSTSNDEIAGNESEKKRPKKISIKKVFGGIKERLKSPRKKAVGDEGSTTTSAVDSIFRTKNNAPRKTSAADMPKNMANGSIIVSKTLIVSKSTGSEATADSTNPNSPVRMYKNYDFGNDSTDENIDTNQSDNETHNATTSREFVTRTASSTDESHSPYIFIDTDDDENDHYTNDDTNSDHQAFKDDGEKDQSAERCTITSVSNATTVDQERQNYCRNFDADISQENIQVQLEQELMKLEGRIKSQREERRAIAQEQLECAMVEEEAIDDDNSREEIFDENNILRISEKRELSSENSPENKQQAKRFSRVFVLLPAALLLMIHWLLSKVWVTAPRYNQDTSIEQATTFFVARSTEGLPMEGITILMSETESELGSTIEDRFASLGATVESLEMIDCNDLNSVAESVDSLLEKVKKENNTIDFLIQTGNLCQTVTQSVKSMTKKTVQGYDALFAGNYLSSFLMTQKILPHLEQSQFGTLVQFTSLASKLVDGSELDIEECLSKSLALSCNSSTGPAPVASRLLQQPKSYFSTLLNLPRQFAYVKLSEILQHEVLTRKYPNIRTMAISKGGWMIGGEGGADEFFHRIFQTKDNPTNLAAVGNNDGDRRDGLYEWSQNAVWKWVAAPSSIATLILGGGGRQNAAAGSIAVGGTLEKSLPLVNNISTTMVTSGALALLAMKYPGFGIWRSSWWTQ